MGWGEGLASQTMPSGRVFGAVMGSALLGVSL